MAAVGVEPGGEDAPVAVRLSSAFEHDRAGAVAEQDAGRPVLPVEDAAERLRADHQRMIGHAALEHIVGDAERVEEAGADRGDVEGDAVVDAERGLDQGRAGRKGLVGRRGGEHDQADLARRRRRPRRAPCAPPRSPASPWSRRRRRCGGPAMPVRSTIHSWVVSTRLGQLGVGDAPRRQRRAGADDAASGGVISPPPAAALWAETLARSSAILRVRSSRTIRAATRIALATPLSLAPPWLFTTRPLRPRKTAPLWLFGIEMVAQQFGRRARDQEADLRADRAR